MTLVEEVDGIVAVVEVVDDIVAVVRFLFFVSARLVEEIA